MHSAFGLGEDWNNTIDTAKTPELLLATASVVNGKDKKDWFGDSDDLRGAGKVIAKQEFDRGQDLVERKYPRNVKLEAKAKEYQANLDRQKQLAA